MIIRTFTPLSLNQIYSILIIVLFHWYVSCLCLLFTVMKPRWRSAVRKSHHPNCVKSTTRGIRCIFQGFMNDVWSFNSPNLTHLLHVAASLIASVMKAQYSFIIDRPPDPWYHLNLTISGRLTRASSVQFEPAFFGEFPPKTVLFLTGSLSL